eukprot:Gregarina_sp_Pseudo_9__624@NODE_139_length_4007_cov_184_780242_g128_i0_p3_GENE_NODE_139_length_4007_cov_184_780242_g128_i0NODE_139_length_4007_cov_184_780242_g128_i0_p3_ORF_typecomplete_len176_score38_60_NODE_139_length_4007_cov_184_780242_g128_i015372064
MTQILRIGLLWLVCLRQISASDVVEPEAEESCSDLWKGVWKYNETATHKATPAHRWFPGGGGLRLALSADEVTDSILMSFLSETETLDAGCEAQFDTGECLAGVLRPMSMRCDWGDVSLSSAAYLEAFFSFWSYTVIERDTDDHSTAQSPQRRELKFVAKWYEQNSIEFVFLIFN